MTHDAKTRLAGELGDDTRALAVLSREQLDELAGLVDDARERVATEIAETREDSLRMLPALIRRPVRKLLTE